MMTTDLPGRENIIPEDWNDNVEDVLDSQQAEILSRKLWFEFELIPVEQHFHADWVSFYMDKLSEETIRKQEWEKRGARTLPFNIRISSYEEDLALRVLQEEFELVVKYQHEAAIEFVRHFLSTLEKEDYSLFAETICAETEYAPNRLVLTEKTLRHMRNVHLNAINEYVLCKGKLTHVFIEEPEPHAGMPARAIVSIGESAYGVELFWSGPVMPDVNGTKYARPEKESNKVGQWYYYRFISPDTEVIPCYE